MISCEHKGGAIFLGPIRVLERGPLMIIPFADGQCDVSRIIGTERMGIRNVFCGALKKECRLKGTGISHADP